MPSFCMEMVNYKLIALSTHYESHKKDTVAVKVITCLSLEGKVSKQENLWGITLTAHASLSPH